MINNLTLNMSNGYLRENSKLTDTIANDLKEMQGDVTPPIIPIKSKKAEEIDLILYRLNLSQVLEYEILDNISYLQSKEMDLENIHKLSKKVKKLSNMYINNITSNEEKNIIEKKTSEYIQNINYIMNIEKPSKDNTMDEMLITIRSSRGQDTILTSNSLYITLDNDEEEEKEEDENDDYFICKLNPKFILSNPSIIEDKMLKPLLLALDNVQSDISYIYSALLDEHSLALASIDDLYNIEGISEGMKNILLTTQNNTLSSVSGGQFKYNNLNNENTISLLI